LWHKKGWGGGAGLRGGGGACAQEHNRHRFEDAGAGHRPSALRPRQTREEAVRDPK
jgi:hypothetical protein